MSATLLPIAHSELAQEPPAPRRGEGSREVNLYPVSASLYVCPAPSPFEKVEVKKWLSAHIEDAGFSLDDAGPRAHLGDQIGDVVE